jgi:hypothetical protein
VLKFDPAQQKWWQKPLVMFAGRLLPAELAVLSLELRPSERGVWMNSRGTTSGVVDLIGERGEYHAQRETLPEFVSETIRRLYKQAHVKKGCPDLVIWNPILQRLRFVEVKNPQWDKPTREQGQFMNVSDTLGIRTNIVEWEFSTNGGAAP